MNTKENKMGTMPVGKLLFQISFPIMISMFIQALYNIVDSYFVGRINEQAFTALSIAFPVQNLMIGIAVGTGVGMNAILSRSLGEKKFDIANRSAENGIILSIIYGIVFFILSFFMPLIYFKTQSTDPKIIEYGNIYLTIICGFSISIYIQIITERMLQATGRTILTMISQSLGAIINIILDPILIFGYFGLPAMGVKGAAVATIIGQFAGAILNIIFNIKLNKDLEIKTLRPSFKIIKEIYEVGIPSIIMITISAATLYFLNKILYKFSSTAVAALGAHFKVQSFVFMPVFGLNNGMIPIIAYNYGARNIKRIKDTIKIAFVSVSIIMFIGTVIFQIFTPQLLKIFSASDELIRIGTVALREISVCFVLTGISIVSISIFQALGNGVLSLVDSAIRQIVVLIPFAYIMSLTGKLELVWWCYLAAEIASMFFIAYYLKNFAFKKINELKGV